MTQLEDAIAEAIADFRDATLLSESIEADLARLYRGAYADGVRDALALVPGLDREARDRLRERLCAAVEAARVREE